MTAGISILHAAEALKGGTATYISEVLIYHVRCGAFSKVAGLFPADEISHLSEPRGVEIATFKKSSRRLIHTLRLAVKFRGLVKHSQPDIVHIHGTWAGVACRLGLLGLRRKPAMVYCSHGWAFDRQAPRIVNRAIALLERLQSPLCDRIVCISQHDKDSAIRAGLPYEKLRLVFNGVADISFPKEAMPWPQGVRRVIFVGRFDRQKGIDVLFEAMRLLGPNYHCVAVGDKALGDAPTPVAPPNVTLTGWLPGRDVQAYMQTAEVALVPSRWEGFGMVAVEAMRAGVPVVASRVGGLCDVVDPSSGRLVEAGNAAELAEAVQALSTADLDAMGKAARDRYLRLFTAERMNNELQALYEELVAGRFASKAAGGRGLA